jgi:hypothetical protein
VEPPGLQPGSLVTNDRHLQVSRRFTRALPPPVPHYMLLFFLFIAAFFCVVIAWFAILFTGRYPRSLFDACVGRLPGGPE